MFLKMDESIHISTVPYFTLLLIITCFFDISSLQMIKKLDLERGDVCRKGPGSGMDYVCVRAKKCKYFAESIARRNYLDICSFEGIQPIVCCPPPILEEQPSIGTKPTIKFSNLADKKCRQYSKLVYKMSTRNRRKRTVRSINLNIRMKIIDDIAADDTDMLIPSVVRDAVAKPREFPHMAIVGYGDVMTAKVKWGCGGSLISERWILTAAHCRKMSSMARWVRIGDLNIISTTDDARPEDYRIVQHVSHPDYKPPSLYNDIALFRLESDVEFSAYVRPICLNSDPSLNPAVQIATGWGKTSTGGSTSANLLKVELDTIPMERCNKSYFSPNSLRLPFGIIPDSMMCAGSTEGGKDTCGGDSGGPLQIKNAYYSDMYTQVGITSFGKFCGDKDAPGVYTRVSKYVSWIEQIVWPDND